MAGPGSVRFAAAGFALAGAGYAAWVGAYASYGLFGTKGAWEAIATTLGLFLAALALVLPRVSHGLIGVGLGLAAVAQALETGIFLLTTPFTFYFLPDALGAIGIIMMGWAAVGWAREPAQGADHAVGIRLGAVVVALAVPWWALLDPMDQPNRWLPGILLNAIGFCVIARFLVVAAVESTAPADSKGDATLPEVPRTV